MNSSEPDLIESLLPPAHIIRSHRSSSDRTDIAAKPAAGQAHAGTAAHGRLQLIKVRTSVPEQSSLPDCPRISSGLAHHARRVGSTASEQEHLS